MVFSNENSQTYLVLNEFDLPSLDINKTLTDNFDYLDLQFDDSRLNSYEKSDNSNGYIFSNMIIVKELGLLYNVNFVLHNKIFQNKERIILESQLYNTRSGGLIKQRETDLINYFNGQINEICLWIGELTGGIKNDWKNSRNSLLFPSENEIIYKKTPLKSALRSFLVPGWGHLYSNKKFQGLIWFGSEFSFGILCYLSFRNYQNSRNAYIANLDLYNNSNDEKEVANYRSLAEDEWAKHKINSELAIFFAKVIGVGWLTNTIHAWLVGPRPKYKIYRKWRP